MPFYHDFISFPIEEQLHSNWCWAACTVAVCRYYDSYPGITQPRLVAQVFDFPPCETGIPYPRCNQNCDFAIPLKHVGHLMGDTIDDPLSELQLLGALQSGMVGCQIDVPIIGGHAVLVVSAKKDSGKAMFHVADPSDGSMNTMSFYELRNNFRETHGRWVRSYMIRNFNQV